MPKYMVRLLRTAAYVVEVDVEDYHEAFSQAVVEVGSEHEIGDAPFELHPTAGDGAIVEVPDLSVGSIVLPAFGHPDHAVPLQGDRPASPNLTEMIIGIVVDEDKWHKHVAWISDQRGAFLCLETPGDLRLAALANRGEMTDLRINQSDLARHIGMAIAKGATNA